MRLKQIVISTVGVTAMVCAYADVERTDSLVDPDWRPVAKESVGVADDGTMEITVPANVPSGFYRLQSKGR